MKVRTSLIVACMTVVPGLALFSHRLPGEVRGLVWSRLWKPVAAGAELLTRENRAETSSDVGPVEAEASPVAAADGEAAGSRAAAQAVAPAPEQLTGMGAFAIDCRPLDGGAGRHVASCRVAVDATGQLHRVFQAAGRSPDEAVAGLTAAVRDWRLRAGLPPPAEAVSSGSRFPEGVPSWNR